MGRLEITITTNSDTRWLSKYNAIHTLYYQYGEMIKALREILTNPTFDDGVASAEILLKPLNLQFGFFLVMWDIVLNQITRVNKVLQSSNDYHWSSIKNV